MKAKRACGGLTKSEHRALRRGSKIVTEGKINVYSFAHLSTLPGDGDVRLVKAVPFSFARPQPNLAKTNDVK